MQSDDTRKSSFGAPTIDLHRKSLRLRLEAYYSLISPDTLKDVATWRSKFEQIYQKYGGSNEGERKLASKLAKKYGTAVRLLLAESSSSSSPSPPPPSKKSQQQRGKGSAHPPGEEEPREESWYKLRPKETGSGDVTFVSSSFDPVAALARERLVAKANEWVKECPLMDTVGQFAFHLPEGDPLRRQNDRRKKRPRRSGDAPAKDDEKRRRRQANLHPFQSISQELEALGGPLSALHRFRGGRVKVVIRYVNAIRGSMTGTLVAFDKHMNLILRDVQEVYSPRPTERDYSKSNAEVEQERRRLAGLESASGWTVRTRKMKQLLVRGDLVVSLNKVEAEELGGCKHFETNR